MKKILVVFSILLIGAALFLLLKNTAEKSTMENATPDVSVDASALFAEFSSDESAANEKYLNKVVVVSGRVAKRWAVKTVRCPRSASNREERKGQSSALLTDSSNTKERNFTQVKM